MILTDEEMEIAENKGFKPFSFSWQDLVLNFLDEEKCNGIDVEQAWLAAIDEVRDAQNTKTDKLSRQDEHRLVCEGLAEWLEKKRAAGIEPSVIIGQLKLKLKREGKVPWNDGG